MEMISCWNFCHFFWKRQKSHEITDLLTNTTLLEGSGRNLRLTPVMFRIPTLNPTWFATGTFSWWGKKLVGVEPASASSLTFGYIRVFGGRKDYTITMLDCQRWQQYQKILLSHTIMSPFGVDGLTMTDCYRGLWNFYATNWMVLV